MPRETVCAWGNCEETETPIIVTIPDWARHRFCCAEHAILGLARYAGVKRGRNTKAPDVLAGIILGIRPGATEVFEMTPDYGPRGRCGGGVE